MKHPATRKEAQTTGATHYFTGTPCKHGHTALRKTKGTCVECLKIEWTQTNAKRSQLPKSEASKAAGRRYYLRNKELVKARAQARPADKKQSYRRKHKKNNPEIYKALTNSRRRRLKDAQPPWVDAKLKRYIRNVYATALRMKANTGIDYEVDHIVPINSDVVCGLHVPWNLQIISKEDNLSKSNRLD